MKPIVIIPARGGSKGIPGKNIKLLSGKPLIQYTIEAALGVFPSNHIIISTDSQDIFNVAADCGVKPPFIRPAELSTDTASSYEVILHAMQFARSTSMEFDTVVLLQPTSPFRTSDHINQALECYSPDLDMVVSVKKSDENPYYSLFEEDENGFLAKSKQGEFTRRQDCPDVFAYNGAIYIMNALSLDKMPIHLFTRIKKYVMKNEDSVDVDTELDWQIAEFIMSKK